MSRIPIDTQLRAHGLRRANPGEESFPVAVHYRNESMIVQAVKLPPEPDPIVVELLRAFVARLSQSRTDLSFAQIKLAMVNYSERVGATDAEVTEASSGLDKLIPQRSAVIMRLLRTTGHKR